jgi:hypothetical protein
MMGNVIGVLALTQAGTSRDDSAIYLGFAVAAMSVFSATGLVWQFAKRA